MNRFFICAFLAGSLLFAGDKTKPQPDPRKECMDKCAAQLSSCQKRAKTDQDRIACETRLKNCKAACPK